LGRNTILNLDGNLNCSVTDLAGNIDISTAITVLTGTATATDLFTVTITNDAPVSFPVGLTTITWTATDANGNTATATQLVTVNLVDVTAPVVTAPIAVTAEATGAATAVILGTASATDAVDGVLIPTNDAPVGGFPVGITTVTYTATDLAGNIGTATQLVTVVDTTAPVITAPVAVIASSGDNLPVAVTLGTATASDLVDAIVNITNDAPATFPVGVTTVTYSAADSAGNISTATQLVTVNLLDVTPPVVTAPIAVTTEATGAATAVILGTASATDIVDGIIITTNDAPIGGFPVGVTTITYSAVDLAGNIGTAMQLVAITDTIAPVITAPVGITANSINGADPLVTLGTATATDLFAVTITNDAPVTFPVGITTVTWTATDANGNSSTATQLVIISLIDTLPPVITVPANVSVSTNTSQATVDIGIASANDNIDGVVAVTNNAPATFPVGATAVIYTASDSAGNTSTATQNIYVSFSSTIGGGSGGGTTTPPAQGGGATVGIEAVYWHHNDHLGTPQAMTDISGTKVWEMSQTPFGITTVNEDPDGDGLLVVNNFRFPGQYYDAETGLYYNYFRSYDPALDRYFQHDPIGLNGEPNPYAYVGGNPITKIDPKGLSLILIEVNRTTVTANSTIGTLSINDVSIGYTLEKPDKNNQRYISSIPAGNYFAEQYTSARFGKTLRLKRVPGRSNILFHPGNIPDDTQGCFLPGASKGPDRVNSSRVAFRSLLDFISKVERIDKAFNESTDIIVRVR